MITKGDIVLVDTSFHGSATPTLIIPVRLRNCLLVCIMSFLVFATRPLRPEAGKMPT